MLPHDAPTNAGGPKPIKLLITQRAMEGFGGTELYTVEVARGMSMRGHQVVIYTPKPGHMTKFVMPSGVKVIQDLADLPFVPDIVHGHHHLPLMAALSHLPTVPAIHVWHGVRPWAEAVPQHPNIARYVITSEHMRPTLASSYDIDPDRIVLIGNYVDTTRFSHVRDLAETPRRALLFGQSGFYPDELRMLDQACADNGLTLDKVGAAYGNARPRPEYFLPDYDIVFAVGRSAIEAMAVGCAVLPIVPQLAGTRIQNETLDSWAKLNFSPRYFTSAGRFNSSWLAAELKQWDPSDIAQVTARVRFEFSMTNALDSYETLYTSVLSEEAPSGSAQDMSAYLAWLATSADDIWTKGERDAREAEKLKREVQDLQEAKHSQEKRVQFLTRLLKDRVFDHMQPRAVNAPDDLKSALLASGLFDADWYLEQNPDVAEAQLDPMDHYLSHGASEGRAPSPGFDVTAFWEAHPDVRGQSGSPLEHLLRLLSVAETKAG